MANIMDGRVLIQEEPIAATVRHASDPARPAKSQVISGLHSFPCEMGTVRPAITRPQIQEGLCFKSMGLQVCRVEN